LKVQKVAFDVLSSSPARLYLERNDWQITFDSRDSGAPKPYDIDPTTGNRVLRLSLKSEIGRGLDK
jgi:predicted metallo-beta-lactamase superfamily hydrolase